MPNILRIHFTRGTGFAGAFVRSWTRSPYAHVSMTTPTCVVDAAPGRGVAIRKAPVGAKTIGFELTSAQAECLEEFILDEMDCGYDWLGDIACGLPWLARNHEDKWFCSEFACAALQHVKILNEAIEPWRVSPQMLFELVNGHPDALYEATDHG